VFSLSLLLPFGDLELDTVQTAEQRLTVMVSSTVQEAPCPDCRTLSSRVHSRYMESTKKSGVSSC
jgi:hypothetical protein